MGRWKNMTYELKLGKRGYDVYNKLTGEKINNQPLSSQVLHGGFSPYVVLCRAGVNPSLVLSVGSFIIFHQLIIFHSLVHPRMT